MSALEKLAVQMATNWHEQQRLIEVLSNGSEPQTVLADTEKRLEELSGHMDNHKTVVFGLEIGIYVCGEQCIYDIMPANCKINSK